MNKFIKTLSIATFALGVSTAAIAQNSIVEEPDSTNIKAMSKTTVVTKKPAASSIMTYDLNNDGMLSRAEIGNKLFYQFDRDGNESLDNIEWNKPIMISLAPVETITITKMDIDGDGVDDNEQIEVDVFMKATGLEAFDNDGNGISPREFTGKSVLQMDIDKSGLIEMKEWKKAYKDSRAPLAANNDIYNDGQ